MTRKLNVALLGYKFMGTAIPCDRITLGFAPGGEEICRPGARNPDCREVYAPGLRLEVSLADCPPLCGDNELGIRWTRRDPDNQHARCMEFLEVLVGSP